MHTFQNKIIRLFTVWNFLFLFISMNAQSPDSVKRVTGKILDASTGTVLPGIKITVPGFSSAITNDSGYFTLKVPGFSTTLLVSGMGYNDKEVALKGRHAVDVALFEESFRSVYDNVTLPEGKKPLSHVVRSVSFINNTLDNWKQTPEGTERDLQGKLAGLNVINRAGVPGIGADMYLRGYTSLNTNNHPLVIVDGMPYDMNDNGHSIIGNYFSNPLTFIDPKDIDNITITKDASSIYGAKAGNGIIYITTAHAKEEATHIDLNVSGGLNYSPKEYPVLGAADYRIYLADLMKTGGYTDQQIQATPFMSTLGSNSQYYAYHNNTDWQKEVFKNSSTKDVFLKVTGGDETAVYGLSLGYLSQGGIVKQTDLSRYNIRFNGDMELTKRLKANANLALTFTENSLADQGINDKTNPLFLSLVKAPFLYPNEISEEGKISPNLADADIFNVSNPSASFTDKRKVTSAGYRFFGSFNISYDLRPSLKLSSLFGLTSDKVRESSFKPHTGFVPDTLMNALAVRTSKYYVQRLFTLYNDTRLTYHKQVGQGQNLAVMAGFRYSASKAEQDLDIAYNSATDDLRTLGDGDASLRQTAGNSNQWNWLNGYLSADYSINSKYYLNAELGVDGSSRFGKEISNALTFNGNKYGVFPSVGAAWLISSEDFMAGLRFINLFKVRVSYGITGNDDIGNYNNRMYYNSSNLYNLMGLTRGNIANPSLQWETNKKFNVGADLALFNERVSMSLDVYRNTTDHMLTYESQPAYVGIPDVVTNNGAMKSKGAEYAVNARILNGKVKWDLGFSVAYTKNTITKIPGNSLYTSYAGATILSAVDGPAGAFYGYKTDGIFKSDADAIASGLMKKMPNGTLVPFRGGDVKFVDINPNGDSKNIIDASDRKIIGDPSPEFTGMFSSSLRWKRLNMDAHFTYSYGNDIFNYTRYRLESMSGFENQTPAVLNRWRVDGQVTDMPRAELGDPYGNNRFSDRWIEDGSYIRFKCLTISYDLPVKVSQIKYATLYASAYNLWTLTSYKGFDPEFSAGSSPLVQGIDLGMFPQYRTIMIGFKLGL